MSKDMKMVHKVNNLDFIKDGSEKGSYDITLANMKIRKHNRDDSKYSRQIANGTAETQATDKTNWRAGPELERKNNEANYYERQEEGAKESNSFMDDIGDDADAWLAANGGAVPSSEPKDIYGNTYDIDDLTETDADLITGGNASRESRLFDGIGSENDTGGTSSMHIQLERFTNMSLPQVKYAYDLLSDPTLTGSRSTRSEFNGETRGVTAKSAVEAAEAFNVTVHGRGEEFRHELGLFLDRADMGASEAGRTMPSRGSKDQMMMMNMLGVTAEAKEEAGPGVSLYGANMNPESQTRADDDVAWLAGKLDDYAVMYNRDDTRRNAPDLYAKRLGATKQALSSWLQEKHPGQKMIDPSTGLYVRIDDPSKLPNDQDFMYESTAVPLPADLGIRGLKMTANKRDNMGSAHTRLSYSKLFPSEETLMASGVYDTKLWNESKASKYSEEDRQRLAPSIKRTFFNKKALGGQEAVDEAYSVMRRDFKKMATIMQRETATTIDENYGNGSRFGALGQTDAEYARQEAINLSKIYDLDQTNEEVSVTTASEIGFGDKTLADQDSITGRGMQHIAGRTKAEQLEYDAFERKTEAAQLINKVSYVTGESVKLPSDPSGEYSMSREAKRVKLQEIADNSIGLTISATDQQGMHGNEGSSDSDHFIELVLGGMPEEEAYEEVVHGMYKGSYKSNYFDEQAAIAAKAPAIPVTDQELYLAKQELRKASGEIHEQRTPGWFEQRKGNITGSGVSKLLSPKGRDALVGRMVDEANGTEKKFVDNFYTQQGTKYEALVQKLFEGTADLKVEEAFFETNEKYKGFGASPDGMVFDRQGNSRGVAEFKMHNSVKAMKKSMSMYYNQIQMQMAITDTKEAHFFRINSETDDYMYDVVARDQDHIDKLIKAGAGVLKNVDFITNNTREDDMGRNLSIDEVNDLIQDSKEDFEGYVPSHEEVKKASKHKAYGTAPTVDVPVTPKDPAGTLSAHVRAFEMESRKISSTEQVDPAAIKRAKQEIKASSMDETKDIAMAKAEIQASKIDEARNVKRAKEEIQADNIDKQRTKKLHDTKMKNADTLHKLQIAQVKSISSMITKLAGFNRGAGETAMSIANNAAALGMDSNQAAGQIDLISEAGNMSFGEAQKLVFAGAAQQNAATSGGSQLNGFMSRQKNAAVTAARGGYTYDVFGPAQMAEIQPGDYLGQVMSSIDGMDKQTQAKILGELGLGAASSLIGRATGLEVIGASHAKYNEEQLRSKDRIIREAATTARDIGFSSLRNTSDTGIEISEALTHVLDNPMGMGSGLVGMYNEGSAKAFNRTGSPFGNLGSATPDDSIQEAMSFRTEPSAQKGKTTVNSKLKVEITESDISSTLTDDFGNTAISTQPRNGGQ